VSRNNFAFVARNSRSVASATIVLPFLLRDFGGATGMNHILAGMIPISNIAKIPTVSHMPE
jgi:hypothetical protein